jgi:RHH-type proline utilization regulon transcriptional repressor/proline dehydrogenase/delta 1-pyrroline-5-carboxylate dehydrogenase
MRADSLTHAIRLANMTPYGLTAGLHSLDVREQRYWIDRIDAGNLYINRGITGAIVQRQPFGGCKASSFGRGAKAGGPNYLTQLMKAEQVSLPKEGESLNKYVEALIEQVNSSKLSEEESTLLKASLESYAFYWKHYFSKRHDPSLIIGQDNFLQYTPRRHMVYRVLSDDSAIDIIRVLGAGATCGCRIELSIAKDDLTRIEQIAKLRTITGFLMIEESEEKLIERIEGGEVDRIRLLSQPSKELLKALATKGVVIQSEPVLANGRIELLNYLREVSLSVDYHRYGNLGDREGEIRAPLTPTQPLTCQDRCANCCCSD